ncbi:Zinc-type alcohol dehydrogenase-like protein [Baekduia alba]|uniref:NADPH:quinone reductase n=1 Tax=Baekduia alba TaxID=2997333 RepID=UPI002341A0EE|nr:NADPH:quinone reductase [Baekduia alba]WCB96499.1 Zinc-type alcohol dehydrogenase-like protein [Baekduia alba]
MRAAWYDRTGRAREVLALGELPAPAPAAGEVLVRVRAAGVNPADVKRRAGAGGRTMAAPRVVPGDDGAGVVEAVGAGVDPARVGQRVWVHDATVGRPWGTSAALAVVDAAKAIRLPDHVDFTIGACLGVPALTAHRAVFGDGPVAGRAVLVTGGAGAVGGYAIQLARWGGARVVATASTPEKTRAAAAAGAEQVVDYRAEDAAERVLAASGGPVDRVVDVAFGANLPLTARVLATGGTIAAYGSDAVPEPGLPFYPLMRRDARLHLVSVFALPSPARAQAIAALTDLLEDDGLRHPIGARFDLDDIAAAHEAVEDGGVVGRVVVTLPTGP